MTTAAKIAWILTGSRLVLAPVWVGIFFLVPARPLFALLLAVLIELTDLLDGVFARIGRAGSTLGAVLDPLADSLFHLFAMLSLGLSGLFSVWWVLPLLYRESLVAGIESLAGIEGNPCFSPRREAWKSTVIGATVLGLLTLKTWSGPTGGVWGLLVVQSAWCIVDAGWMLATQGLRISTTAE